MLVVDLPTTLCVIVLCSSLSAGAEGDGGCHPARGARVKLTLVHYLIVQEAAGDASLSLSLHQQAAVSATGLAGRG